MKVSAGWDFSSANSSDYAPGTLLQLPAGAATAVVVIRERVWKKASVGAEFHTVRRSLGHLKL
jgi:hypothetical protein